MEEANAAGAKWYNDYRKMFEEMADQIDGVVISTLEAFGGRSSTVENLRQLRAAGATVLYGTDIPIRQSSVKIGAVLGAKITNADRQKIFFDNTAKLLNLN